METLIAKLESDNLYKSIFNAIPSMTFIVDIDMRLLFWNTAAAAIVGNDHSHIFLERTGNLLHCINAAATAQGCGHGPGCSTCIIRNSVRDAIVDKKRSRKQTRLTIERDNATADINFLVTAEPFDFHGHAFAILILQDISELIQLRSLLPICAGCKKIRDDQNYWSSVESYFSAHLDVDFSHGICPECMERLYPEYHARMKKPE